MIIVLLVTACNNSNQNIKSEDTTFLNSDNWVVQDRKNLKDSSIVTMKFKLGALRYEGKGMLNSEGIFLKDDNGEYVFLVDFNATECSKNFSINGNNFFLLKSYLLKNYKEKCFVYYYKLPYSISHKKVRDSFIFFVSKIHGIVGISDYRTFKDSLRIESFVGDSSFLDHNLTIKKCW